MYVARDVSDYPHTLPHTAAQCHPNDQFIALLDAYRDNGGLARANEVLVMLKNSDATNAESLANWIVKGKVICFEWQSKLWLPLFQFKPLDMTPLPGLDQVMAELCSTYNAWQTANWFAQPNAWLANDAPAARLLSDLPAVLQAARSERFIAVD
jgi:hypothetical protein